MFKFLFFSEHVNNFSATNEDDEDRVIWTKAPGQLLNKPW